MTCHVRRAVGSLILTACALALSGCGGSGHRRATADTWIDRADAACSRANEQIRVLDSDPANRAGQASWDRVRASFARFRAISRSELSRVRAPAAPQGAPVPQRLITLMRLRDDAVARQLAAAERGDLVRFEQEGEAGTNASVPFMLLAHGYGMRACAESVAIPAGASAEAAAIVRAALAVTWWCNSREGVLPAGDAALIASATRELVRVTHGAPDAVIPYLGATDGAPATFRAALNLTASTLRSCGTAPLAAQLARELARADRALSRG